MNPLATLIAALVLLAVGAAGGYGAAYEVSLGPLNEAKTALATAQRDQEKGRADGNQAAIDNLTAGIRAALDANGRTAAAAAARAARLTKFMQDLANDPDTKNCTSSPAFKSLFDSVRREPGSGSPDQNRLPAAPGHDVQGQSNTAGR